MRARDVARFGRCPDHTPHGRRRGASRNKTWSDFGATLFGPHGEACLRTIPVPCDGIHAPGGRSPRRASGLVGGGGFAPERLAPAHHLATALVGVRAPTFRAA
jgi:hypothetical protein